MPLPSPNGYPNGGGFGPPPGHHGHPHHPSFGNNGLHIGNQNGGGMGMSHGQGGFGMGMYGGGSPPRNGGESQMPITPLWQQQIAKADVSQSIGDG
jgi:CCR4-NOT transcription complex subunit 6